jgi:Zn-dependent peptidase ImmA (M78 family)
MSAELRELGRRLAKRRDEAGLSSEELARLAAVETRDIEAFEQGQGSLGIHALTSVAKALGVPPASFVHTRAPQVKALTEPSILLKTTRDVELKAGDREALIEALRRARAFVTIGEILGIAPLDCELAYPVPPIRRAYEQGYDAALKVRRKLPERPGPLRGLRRLIETRFNILVVNHRFTTRAILGASCRSGSARLIALNSALSSGEGKRRFVLAHELAHHLLDLDESGIVADEDSDAIGFWLNNPPREQRSNAFAAMLLAPGTAIEEYLGKRVQGGYGLKEARQLVSHGRKMFGLSFAAMAWHLHNRKYLLTEETVKALLTSSESDDVDGFEEDTRFDGLERRVLEALERDLISRLRASELLGRPVNDLLDA